MLEVVFVVEEDADGWGLYIVELAVADDPVECGLKQRHCHYEERRNRHGNRSHERGYDSGNGGECARECVAVFYWRQCPSVNALNTRFEYLVGMRFKMCDEAPTF